MGILHIKHGVVAGLAHRQLQVELKVAVCLAHVKEKPCRVYANFL